MIIFTFYSNKLCDSFSDFGYATTSTKMNELFTIYSRFESLFTLTSNKRKSILQVFKIKWTVLWKS